MEWKTPYVIYRLVEGGKAKIVSTPEDLVKAKYWLQYIAEPFDVLCKSPLHPKHTKKAENPEYWAHKEPSGKPSYAEAEWKAFWQKGGWDTIFSEETIPG
jgi:hypothetical protein